MDKIIKYENILITILKKYAAAWSQSDNSIQSQTIIDKEGKHYQFIRYGWKGDDYRHQCVFHFDIISSKVWIQENRTDIEVGQEMVQMGIPKKDIVLGLLHPQFRADSEYAAS